MIHRPSLGPVLRTLQRSRPRQSPLAHHRVRTTAQPRAQRSRMNVHRLNRHLLVLVMIPPTLQSVRAARALATGGLEPVRLLATRRVVGSVRKREEEADRRGHQHVPRRVGEEVVLVRFQEAEYRQPCAAGYQARHEPVEEELFSRVAALVQAAVHDLENRTEKKWSFLGPKITFLMP